MNKISNCVMIAITETKMQIEIMSNESVEARLKKAMELMQQHWLVTNQEEQFQAAIGAVLLTATEDEKERINGELKTLRALNAAASGVPVDMTQAFESMESYEPIGLTKLWKDIQAPSQQEQSHE